MKTNCKSLTEEKKTARRGLSNLILWGRVDVIKSFACSHYFRSFEEYRSKPHKSKLLKPSDRYASCPLITDK